MDTKALTSTVALADRVAVLEDVRITGIGTHAELLARLGQPIARRIQRHTSRAYLQALREAAS